MLLQENGNGNGNGMKSPPMGKEKKRKIARLQETLPYSTYLRMRNILTGVCMCIFSCICIGICYVCPTVPLSLCVWRYEEHGRKASVYVVQFGATALFPVTGGTVGYVPTLKVLTQRSLVGVLHRASAPPH